MSWVECFAPQRFAFRISLSDRFLHRPLHRPRAVHRGAAQEGKPRSAFGLAVRILEYKSPCSALESYPGGYFVPLKKKKKNPPWGSQNPPAQWSRAPYALPAPRMELLVAHPFRQVGEDVGAHAPVYVWTRVHT